MHVFSDDGVVKLQKKINRHISDEFWPYSIHDEILGFCFQGFMTHA